jgi:membrane-bound lytic murein transglycosylase D
MKRIVFSLVISLVSIVSVCAAADSLKVALPDSVTVAKVDSLALDSAEMEAFHRVIEDAYVRWRYELHQNDSCQTITWNDTLKKEDYIRYLSQMPTIINMSYNEVVRNYIDAYVRKYPKRLSYLLSLSKYYFPIFENALEAGGVPLEL